MADGKAHETVLDANMANHRLARVYAESLLAVAHQKGQAEQITDELDTLVALVRSNPGIAAFLANPTISRKSKAPVIAQAFGGKVSDLLATFLGVLNANGRLDMLGAVRAAVNAIQDQRAGRLRVTVTAAVPLPADQQDKIKQTLKSALNKDAILTVRENPDLLGGLVIQFGDKVVDSSVRSRLESLRANLLSQGTSYVLQN